jgi:putative ABC transport system permease protein
MRTIIRRAWHAIRRRRLEADLAEEIEFHRAMKERDLKEGGLDPAEATFAARRALGNVLIAQDDARDVWMWPWVQGVWQDLRFAVRLLLKDRGFATAAVLTLALGIGANVTIFSAVYAVLLKPLPFADPDRLVTIWKRNQPRGWVHNPISAAEFLAWRSQTQAFDEMAAFRPRSCVLTGESSAEEDPCETVSSNLFSMLGVTTIRGRAFSTEEDDPTKSRVAILSDALWQRRFGGDVTAIGRTISINGLSHTIVGVMPAGFAHLYATPFAPVPQLWVSGIDLSPSSTWNDYMATARLKRGIGLRQAEAAMTPASVGLEQMYPDLKGWRSELRTLREMNSGDAQSALLVLLGAVTCVLLIACANLANLLLARGAGRTHEFALRAALGAAEWRLVRQLLTESLLIALTGGALGLALAWWGTRALPWLAPEYLVNSAPAVQRAPLDLRVLAFALLASLATTLLFGLVPAIHGAKPEVAETLKETSRRSLHPRRGRFRSVLVVTQIALAMVLLVGAGLMIRTLAGLHAVNLGVETTRVLTLRVPLAGDRYKDPQASLSFWNEVVRSVRALPGVEYVSVSRGVPIGDWAGQFFTTADRPNPPAGQVPDANYVVVGEDYFKALRIPLRQGRTFDEHDTQSADRAVIVNEELVRLHWPGQNPLGRRLRMGSPASAGPWLSVVGVVGNVLSQGVDSGVHPEIYVPYQQYPWVLSPQNLIVRTAEGVTPGSLTAAVVRDLQRVDKDQPAADIRTLEQLAGEPMAKQRMVTALLGAFAGLALVLSALGVYGVLSYSVAQRTREIGVRIALGAHPGSMLRLVVGDGGRLTAIGIAAGSAAALALTRLLTDLLYGVRPTDSLTFVAGIVVLSAASLLACYIPARRAMRVDPIEVLRQ